MNIVHNGTRSLTWVVILFVYSFLCGCISDLLTLIKHGVCLSVIGIMAQL